MHKKPKPSGNEQDKDYTVERGEACALGYGGLICKKEAGRWQVTMEQKRWTQVESERL